MEGMVTDLQLAKEKQQAFEEWKRAEGRTLGIDITVTVLTIGFWPTYKVSSFFDVCHGPSVHVMLPLMHPYSPVKLGWNMSLAYAGGGPGTAGGAGAGHHLLQGEFTSCFQSCCQLAPYLIHNA